MKETRQTVFRQTKEEFEVNAGDNSSAGMFPVCWCKSNHDHHKQDYHRMTDKEIADKLARISAAQAANTDQALERILAGQ